MRHKSLIPGITPTLIKFSQQQSFISSIFFATRRKIKINFLLSKNTERPRTQREELLFLFSKNFPPTFSCIHDFPIIGCDFNCVFILKIKKIIFAEKFLVKNFQLIFIIAFNRVLKCIFYEIFSKVTGL